MGTFTCEKLYVLAHSCSENEIDRELLDQVAVTFCLPINKKIQSERVAPVFYCIMPVDMFNDLIKGNGAHLENLYSTLDKERTFRHHRKVLEKLYVKVTPITKERKTISSLCDLLISLMATSEGKTIALFKRKYIMLLNAVWFVRKFGPSERLLVMSSKLYWFDRETELIDLQMLKSYLCGYDVSLSDELQVVDPTLSLLEVSKICCQSRFNQHVELISQYLKRKLEIDDAYINKCQELADTYRESIQVSNLEFIQYIYLAEHECFGPGAARLHTENTTFSKIVDYDCDAEVSTVYNNFFLALSESIDPDKFLKNKVNIKQFVMPGGLEIVKQKTYCIDWKSLHGFSGWVGTRAAVTLKMKQVDDKLARVGYNTTMLGNSSCVKQLLELSANVKNVHGCLKGPSAVFTIEQPKGPFPVFRVELPHNNHVFLMSLEENWYDEILQKNEAACFSKESYIVQSYINRHEYFNKNLFITNMILDVDLNAKQEPSVDILKEIVFHITECIKKIWAVLFDQINPNVFVYKTARDENNPCKIGFRVIAKIPPPFVLIGTKAITDLAEIVQRLVAINGTAVRTLNLHFTNWHSMIDVSIYNHGRSIRIPYSYKVTLMGSLYGRLSPFLISTSPPEILHSDSSVFLHHAQWPDTCSVTQIHVISSFSESSASFIEHRIATNYRVEYGEKPSLLDICERTYKCNSLDSLIYEVAIPHLLNYIREFHEDKIEEFVQRDLRASMIREEDTWCFLSICSNSSNFTCFRYRHRKQSKNVRLFLALSTTRKNKIYMTAKTQCFANKCQSNIPQTLFTLTLQHVV